jgi:exodeoxyribonuclease VII large subunit
VLARAIAGSTVPIVTGIGHETDSSVADLIAARSFKTPTACGAGLIDQARTAIDRSERTWTAISARARVVLDRHQHDLLTVGRRLAFDTHARLSVSAAHTDAATARLTRCVPNAMTDADRRVATLAARLDAVDPQRALARGWSITRTATGTVVRHADQVQPGDTLVTTVEAGTVRSIVNPDDTGSAGTIDDPTRSPDTPDEPDDTGSATAAKDTP